MEKTTEHQRQGEMARRGFHALDEGYPAQAGKTRPTGLEPATFGSTVRCRNLEATQRQGLTGDAPTGRTKSADSGDNIDENRRTAPAADGLRGDALADALALVARLPGLSDAERAEAVRRLLKGGKR